MFLIRSMRYCLAMIILYLLVCCAEGSEDLPVRSKPSKQPPCKNPRGMIGESLIEKCLKKTCTRKGKKAYWKESIASDTCCNYNQKWFKIGQNITKILSSDNCTIVNVRCAKSKEAGPKIGMDTTNNCANVNGVKTLIKIHSNNTKIEVEELFAKIDENANNTEVKMEELSAKIDENCQKFSHENSEKMSNIEDLIQFFLNDTVNQLDTSKPNNTTSKSTTTSTSRAAPTSTVNSSTPRPEQIKNQTENITPNRELRSQPIDGLLKEDFEQLNVEERIDFFKGLCRLRFKRMVLDLFCEGIQNCFYLVARGTTDTQRLKLLSNNPEDRNLYYGETCDEECEQQKQNIQTLRDTLVIKVNLTLSAKRRKGAGKGANYKVNKEMGDKKFLGGTKDNWNDATDGLNALLKFGIDMDDAEDDEMKMLESFIDLTATIGPLLGPKGQALAMLAGPLKLALGMGGEKEPSTDDLIKTLMKDLTNKVEDEHKKTKQYIHFEIDAQTKQMQAGFTSMENSISDNTALIGRQVEAQTKLIIKEIQQSNGLLATSIEKAIIIFSTSNREQTNQILNEVQLQNREQFKTLQNLYSKADQDSESFYDALDELNGMRDKFVLMDVFLSKSDDDHIYEDLSSLMNQFNTFEGAKQLGSTRSWMTRFCDDWQNAFLCMDLLTLYVSIATLRDKIFINLAATIKNSDHCDADVLADQIMETTSFRKNRDGDFLAKMVLNTNSDTALCLISFMTQELATGNPAEKCDSAQPSLLCMYVEVDEIIASSTYGSTLEYGPLFAIDGKLSVINKYFLHTNFDPYSWVQLKLSDPQMVAGVEIYNRVDCCGERLRNIEVRAGLDPLPAGTTGQELLTQNEKVGFFAGPGKNGGIYKVMFTSPKLVQFITMQLTEKNSLQLNEMKVIGASEAFIFPGTVLEGPRTFKKSSGSLICKYLEFGSENRCTLDRALFPGCVSKIKCKTGFYSKYSSIDRKSSCLRCRCNLKGTIQGKDGCNDNGKCFCTSFYNGDKCENCKKGNTADCSTGECQDGFYNSPTEGCVPCSCSRLGTIGNTICDKTTGQCKCKVGYTGQKCDQCQQNFYENSAGNCLGCSCSSNLALAGHQCNSDGTCKCKANAIGSTCYDCKSGYYKTVDNACVACGCNADGSVNSECTDGTGKCTCNQNYDPTDQKCIRCNPSNAYQNAAGGCDYCNCHTAGTLDKENCDAGGACDCQGDYAGITGNLKCRLMKGFTTIRIKFGSNGGDKIKLRLTNKETWQKCTTGYLDMNKAWKGKGSWSVYSTNSDYGDCKGSWIMCGNAQLIVETLVPGYANDVEVGGIVVTFGTTEFYYDFGRYYLWLRESGCNWLGHNCDYATFTHTISCSKNCDLTGCPGNRRKQEKNNSSWIFPNPYETITMKSNVHKKDKIGTLKKEQRQVGIIEKDGQKKNDENN